MKTYTLDVVTAINDEIEKSRNLVHHERLITNSLILNLASFKTNNVEISDSLCEKLREYAHCYATDIVNLLQLEKEDFAENLRLLALLLEFVNVDAAELILSNLLDAVDNSDSAVAAAFSSDSGRAEKLVRFLKIVHVSLASTTGKRKRKRKRCPATFCTRMEEVLLQSALVPDKSVIMYAMTVLVAYCEFTDRYEFVAKLWFEVLKSSVEDESRFEHYLLIMTYLIDSTIGERTEVRVNIFAKSDFWAMLKKCFTSDACNHKYPLYVLKYSVLVQSAGTGGRTREYDNWWKTYFLIMESFEEKQTHLILPMFAHLRALIDNDAVNVDQFWILKLLENGLKHDSRTVRLETAIYLFDTNVNRLEKAYFPFIAKMLLNNVCNDSPLFRKAFKTKNFHRLEEKFIHWTNELGSRQDFPHFLNVFYREMVTNCKWSPVPLFYTLSFLNNSSSSRSRSRNKTQPCLGEEMIRVSKSFISTSVTKIHNVKIRTGIQRLYLKCITANCAPDHKSALAVLDLLNAFNADECLTRHSTTWRNLLDYVATSADRGQLNKYVTGLVKSHIENDDHICGDRTAIFIVRSVLLCYDATLLQNDSFLVNMAKAFENLPRKPYARNKSLNNRLKFVVYLYKLSLFSDVAQQKSAESDHITLQIRGNAVNIFTFLVESLLNADYDDADVDPATTCFYQQSLDILFPCIDSFLDNTNAAHLLDLWSTRASVLLLAHKGRACGAMKIIAWIYKVIDFKRKLITVNKLRSTLSATMAECITDSEYSSSCIRFRNEDHSLGGGDKMYSNYVDNFWTALRLYLSFEKGSLGERALQPTLLRTVLESLHVARKENFSNIFEALGCLCLGEGVLEHQELIVQVMRESWLLLKETQTTPYYLISLASWIRVFFTERFLRINSYREKLIEYVYEILRKVADNGGQSYESIVLILNQLEEIEDLFDVHPQSVTVLVDVFCVTHINRNDQRIEQDVVNYMKQLSDGVVENTETGTVSGLEETRLKALYLLLKKCEDRPSPVNVHYCSTIIRYVLSFGINKKRYFNDSSFHRIFHKRLQLLLIFEALLETENTSPDTTEIVSTGSVLDYILELFNFVNTCLLSEPHQPSVRYMLEWILIRLVFRYPTYLRKKFWHSFTESSDERVGSICSFISVTYHLANVLREEMFIEEAVQFVLPWTMAQHFNARLYAQTVLVKLIRMNDIIAQKYEVVLKSLQNTLKTGNAVKNSIKLQRDFYFSSFHPIHHFSLQTILWDLPRLSNISDEEWVPPELYKQFLPFEYTFLPYSSGNELVAFDAPFWNAKIVTPLSICETAELNEEKENLVEVGGETQKKFIPRDDLLLTDSASRRSSISNLIVVASLIDRIPNLGGLTRTCEIFSVNSLIINNMDIIRNKEFTSLSITAEKHVHIKEVKKYDLFNYLKKMKEREFCIIGAEQTSNSGSLEQFKFPSKSVLVLGNETEGIPANLLALLDICIEIPQMGMIRSLNVHVSASLFIWEYVKQHFLH